MRVVVVGLGVQGYKRRRVAGPDFVTAVDPKIATLGYLLDKGKHVLVEKPLWAPDEGEIERLQTVARRYRVVCYTAYNHRFEPHFVRMRDLIASARLGPIYRCRMFYGNGTARLV